MESQNEVLPLTRADCQLLTKGMALLNKVFAVFAVAMIVAYGISGDFFHNNPVLWLFPGVFLLMVIWANLQNYQEIRRGEKVVFRGTIDKVQVASGVYKTSRVVFNEDQKAAIASLTVGKTMMARGTKTIAHWIWLNGIRIKADRWTFWKYRPGDEVYAEYTVKYHRLIKMEPAGNTPLRDPAGWKTELRTQNSRETTGGE